MHTLRRQILGIQEVIWGYRTSLKWRVVYVSPWYFKETLSHCMYRPTLMMAVISSILIISLSLASTISHDFSFIGSNKPSIVYWAYTGPIYILAIIPHFPYYPINKIK